MWPRVLPRASGRRERAHLGECTLRREVGVTGPQLHRDGPAADAAVDIKGLEVVWSRPHGDRVTQGLQDGPRTNESVSDRPAIHAGNVLDVVNVGSTFRKMSTKLDQAHLAEVRIGDDKTGRWGYIDKTGKMVISPQFDWTFGFSEGLAAVNIGDLRTGKAGYIDRSSVLRFRSAVAWLQSSSETGT